MPPASSAKALLHSVVLLACEQSMELTVKYVFALGIIVSAVWSSMSSAAAKDGTKHPAIVVKVVAFNDFHGNLQSPGQFASVTGQPPVVVGGADYLAAYIAERLSHNPNHVVVGAGDMVGASPLISASYHDEGSIEVLNLLGLQLSSVGNHEFDAGRSELLRKQRGGCFNVATYSCLEHRKFPGAGFKYLAANVVVTDTGATLFPGYSIRSFHGVKIAFVGLVLKATPNIVLPSGVVGLDFRDEAGTVSALLPTLRAQHVNSIIVLIHQGGAPDSTFPNGTSINDCAGINGSQGSAALTDVVSRLPDAIDAVISAHSHYAYNCKMKNSKGRLIPVTQASAFGRVITDIDLTFDLGTRRLEKVSESNVLISQPDADLAASPVHAFLSAANVVAIRSLIKDYAKAVAPLANSIVGRIAKALPSKPDDSGSGETLAGDLVVDSQLAATSSADTGHAVMALINGSGVRDRGFIAADGKYPRDVSYQDAFNVRPFGNSLVSMTMTAEQLKDALEQQFAGCNGQTGDNILQVSKGLKVEWSSSAPPCSKIVTLTLASSVGGAREEIVKNHIVQHPEKSYRVSIDNFLAAGKSNFTVFLKGTDQQGGPQDIDALVMYLKAWTLGSGKPFDPSDPDLEIPRIRKLN
jgi:5'-nucleotidase